MANLVDLNRSKVRLFAATLALAVLPANAETIYGKVVRVADGDTLTILSVQTTVRVRLTDIDAPELKQAYGRRSKQSLSELCAGDFATLQWNEKDRYGRVLGRVTCKGIDANAEQVRRGMAWVYDRYVKDRTLYQYQLQAQTSHSGLWADPRPQAPWIWRRVKKAR